MSSGFEPLVERYYVPDTSTHLALGRICWAPITFVEPNIQVAEVAGTVPSDDSATTFKIVPFKCRAHPPHPPVFQIKLGASEHIRVARMKMRPAIVLSSRADPWKDKGGTATRQSAKARLVAPLYTIADYSSGWTARVQRFEYNSHFFLPANPLDKGKPDRDVFVRFEQVQAVHEKVLEPCPSSLHPEALEFLLAWFFYFVSGEHSEMSELLSKFYEPAA